MKEPRIAFITQARTASTRLPGKVLKTLQDRPVLSWFMERAFRCTTPTHFVVATTDREDDDNLARQVRAAFGDRLWITRGSSGDVLARYAQAASEVDADIIIRVTSDCPFLDWELVDRCVATLRTENGDAVRTVRGSFPHGLDVDVFTRHALERAHSEAAEPHEREHVGPYIFEHPELFSVTWLENDGPQWPECRLTLDYPEDLELTRVLYERVGPLEPVWKYRAFLEAHPEAASINRHRAEKR